MTPVLTTPPPVYAWPMATLDASSPSDAERLRRAIDTFPPVVNGDVDTQAFIRAANFAAECIGAFVVLSRSLCSKQAK